MVNELSQLGPSPGSTLVVTGIVMSTDFSGQTTTKYC